MRFAVRALWVGVVMLAGAGVSLAEEPPGKKPAAAPAAPAGSEVKDGKWTDPYWGLVLAAEGLTETIGLGAQGQIFSGECPDGVQVEILVAQDPEEMSAREWSQAKRAMWATQGRKMTEVEEPEGAVPTVLFVEESLAGFKRHHGYAFYARGLQCFLVHAMVREKSESSGAAIRAKLVGLRLGEDTGASTAAMALGKQAGLPPTDPKIRLAAGQAYANPKGGNFPLSLRILTRLQKEVREGDLNADETWALYEWIGISSLQCGKAGEAIEWLKKAEVFAEKTKGPGAVDGQSAYNLACACARDGKSDLAFEALRRCARKSDWAFSWESAQTDPDLESLKEDPRWAGLKDAGKVEGK